MNKQIIKQLITAKINLVDKLAAHLSTEDQAQFNTVKRELLEIAQEVITDSLAHAESTAVAEDKSSVKSVVIE